MGTIRALIDTRLDSLCRRHQIDNPASIWTAPRRCVHLSAVLEFPATTLHVASWEA